MKFFYVVLTQITTVMLSPNNITTLHFDKKITACDIGASESVVGVKYRRSKTAVSLYLKKGKIDSNITCYFEDGMVNSFNLKYSAKPVHKYLIIKEATRQKGGSLLFENEKIKIFEGSKNYYVVNKSGKKITVNEEKVLSDKVVSKWSPIFVDGVKISL